MSLNRKRVALLGGAFLVQFQAAASGLLPALPGVPTTVVEWATFCAYFVLTVLAHIPKLKSWFAEAKKAAAPEQPEVPTDEAEPSP